MDVISFGAWELAFAWQPDRLIAGQRRTEQIAVAYDDKDSVIGVFDHFGHFAELPEDGFAAE